MDHIEILELLKHCNPIISIDQEDIDLFNNNGNPITITEETEDITNERLIDLMDKLSNAISPHHIALKDILNMLFIIIYPKSNPLKMRELDIVHDNLPQLNTSDRHQ